MVQLLQLIGAQPILLELSMNPCVQRIEGIDNADEIETYILSLKNSTIKQVRNKLRANKKISKDERILKEIDKIDDTRLLSALTELIYGGE